MTTSLRYDNLRNFDVTLKSIFKEANKPSESSFAKWIERAKLCREALLENQRQHADELKKMEGIWAARVVDEKRKQFQEEETGILQIAKDLILEDLDAVLSAKEAKYHEAMSAPTDEMIRLLTVLQMRADSGEELSSSDFANAASYVSSNFHALKQLSNLAKNSGIPFPRLTDSFYEDISTAREGANNLLSSLDKPEKSLGYYETLFWKTGHAGLAQEAFDKLDRLSYLTVTPEDVNQVAIDKAVREKARKCSEAGDTTPAASKFCSKVKLNGLEDIAVVSEQFHTSRAAIAELNPGMDLDHLYKGGELFIPSTKFTYTPGSTSAVQESQITLSEKPVFTDPVGPHGEQPGDDIDIVSETFD